MNAHVALAIAAVVLSVAGIALAPARFRRGFTIVAILTFTASLLTQPAMGSFTAANPSHTRPTAPNVTYSAYTIGDPSTLRCQWIDDANATSQSVRLTWTNGSSWATTQARRQDNGGGYADYGTAAAAAATSFDDTSATSAASHTYDYRIYHKAGSTWSGNQLGVVSTTGTALNIAQNSTQYCRQGIAKVFTPQQSKLNSPSDVARDSSGNVFIADMTNHVVRMVAAADCSSSCPLGLSSTTAGYIYTVAGLMGLSGSTGDTGAATSAKLASARGVTVNSSGDLFIADTGNHSIRFVPNSTCAAACTAQYGLSTWTKGNIYTIAGSLSNSGNGTYDGACSTTAASASAKLNSPRDVGIDSSGNLYVTDQQNNRLVKIRKSDDKGCSFAGTGVSGFTSTDNDNSGTGVVATSAKVQNPEGIVADSAGNVLFADKTNHEIRMVAAANCASSCAYGISALRAGYIYNVAGTNAGTSGNAADNVVPVNSAINAPWNLDVSSTGDVLFSDSNNGLVRLLHYSGSNTYGASATTTNRMYKILGTGSSTYQGNGWPLSGTYAANIATPYGVAFDGTNNKYYAVDNGKNVVRYVDATAGLVWSYAGIGSVAGGSGTDPGAANGWDTLSGTNLYHSAVDSSGNLFYPDFSDNRVKEWYASGNAAGYVRVVAGTGASSDTGDGGNGLAATVKGPAAVAIDSAGNNLYVADTTGATIRKLDITGGTIGNISTIAGTSGNTCSTITSCGENISPTAAGAKFNSLADIAVDSNGSVFITDYLNCTVRMVWHTGSPTYGLVTGGANGAAYASLTDGNIYKIAGTQGTCSSTGDAGGGNSGTLNGPDGIDVDSTGNVYVAERSGYKIRKIASTGVISTAVGNNALCGGWSDNTAYNSVNLCHPRAVSWDSTTSSLYFSDATPGAYTIGCLATSANSACGHGTALGNATANNVYKTAGGGSGGVGGWAQDANLGAESLPVALGGGALYIVPYSTTYDFRIVPGPDP